MSEPSSPSVVVESNAKVHVSKWPLWAALGVVAALVVFTVVWFAANGEDDYTPGPVAQGLLDGLEGQGVNANLAPSELKCVDDAGAKYDIDPAMFAGGVDVLDVEPSADEQAFVGVMMDDCLTRNTRVDIIAQGMLGDADMSDVTEAQARCVGEKMDDAITDAGGYGTLAEDPEAAFGLVFGIFGSLGECGIDMTDMMGMGG